MAGHSFDLESDTISIGRDPDNDIQIKDPSISRKHAIIFKKDDKYSIEDLNSRNGVWINGNPLKPRCMSEVTEGVPVAMGRVFFSLGKRDIYCLAPG